MQNFYKGYVGTAVTMGVGNTVLESMGQGALAGKMSSGMNLMGVYGMMPMVGGITSQFQQKRAKRRKKRRK